MSSPVCAPVHSTAPSTCLPSGWPLWVGLLLAGGTLAPFTRKYPTRTEAVISPQLQQACRDDCWTLLSLSLTRIVEPWVNHPGTMAALGPPPWPCVLLWVWPASLHRREV